MSRLWKRGTLLLLILWILLLPVSVQAKGAEEAEEEEPFSLLLETEYGTFAGYQDKNEYTVFVPSGLQTDPLVLQYTGPVYESEEGKLDRQKKTLTVPMENGLSFALQMEDRTAVNVTVLSSSLPSVLLTLPDADIETLHEDKSRRFYGNSVTVLDPAHPENCFTDTDCTVHGRGNSSWAYFEKRGYLLKLKKKQGVLGMNEARDWCLIGNPNDGTLMKNRIAYEIAKAGDFQWSPHAEYADLWINGDYRGLYLVTEQVEIANGRLELRDRNAVVMELDNMFYLDSELWFESDVTGMFLTVKDAVSDGALKPVELFREKYEQFEKLLHTAGVSFEELEEAVDMDSFAEYYLLNEMLLNKELLCTSLYMYVNGKDGLIHAGPVWDFDTCMNSTGDTPDANALQYMGSTYFEQTDLFALLCTHEEFVKLVNRMYKEKYHGILERIPDYIDVLSDEIADSARMNFRRYPRTLGSVTVKGDIIGESFEKNLSDLQEWLKKRAEVFVPAVQRWYPMGVTEQGGGRGIVRTEELLKYYAPVFNAEYYAEKNPDLVAVYGSNPGAMLLHFLKYGTKSGRPAHKTFVLADYISDHPELWSVYGSDRLKYLDHYIASVNPGSREEIVKD